MAIPSNTYGVYTAKGIKEDLEDVIYSVDMEETPFVSNVGRSGKADNTLHEWQTDSLAAVDTANAQLDGDDAANQSITATVRVGNYTQISRKVVGVTGTMQAVDKAGRGKDELAYQMVKKGKELRRDIEAISVGAQAAVAGDGSTTARKAAAFETWLKTNSNRGATGADPVYTTIPTAAPTDGTQRAFTETILKDVVKQVYTEGGKLKLLMVGPSNKVVVSGFAGIAEVRKEVSGNKPAVIVGAADVYVSDFGNLAVVPNIFQRDRSALFIDPSMASIVTLRPIQRVKLAKTGDSEREMLITEWTLKVHNEKAHGIAADLLTP